MRGRAEAEDVEQDAPRCSLPSRSSGNRPRASIPSRRRDRRWSPRANRSARRGNARARESPVRPRRRRRSSCRSVRMPATRMRGVDHRELAVPRAPARLQIEEVIVEAAIAGGVRLLALGAVAKESQRRQRPRGGLAPRQEAAFRADDVDGEPEAGGGDAAGRAGPRAVGDQAVSRIGGAEEVTDGALLESSQLVAERSRQPSTLGLRQGMRRS